MPWISRRPRGALLFRLCIALGAGSSCSCHGGDDGPAESADTGPHDSGAHDANTEDGAGPDATIVADGGGPARDGGASAEDGGAGNDGGRDGAASDASSEPITARGIRVIGRADLRSDSTSRFSWSGAGFEAHFEGTGLSAELSGDVDGLVLDVVVDGAHTDTLVTHTSPQRFELARGLAAGPHRVRFTRETEGQMGTSTLTAISVAGGALTAPARQPRPLIEVVGDSISAGYGILGANQYCSYSFDSQRFSTSYGALTAGALGGEAVGLAISGHGMYRNLDNGTELLLPAAYDRAVTNDAEPAWLDGLEPDVIVVNLGTNDYGASDPSLPDPSTPFRDAYVDFASALRRMHPDALIVCAFGSMVSDGDLPRLTRLRNAIASVVSARTAAGDTRIVGIEFPLDEMDDLGCDWHPNAKKHAAMASQLTALLRGRGY